MKKFIVVLIIILLTYCPIKYLAYTYPVKMATLVVLGSLACLASVVYKELW